MPGYSLAMTRLKGTCASAGRRYTSIGRRKPRGSLALLALLSLSGASEAAPSGPFTLVESGQRFARLQDAVNAIGNGQATILIAPGVYGQCAVQAAGAISYRAALPGRSVFQGRACEGKAALVLRGRAARVEGIVFAQMAVADGNGAGIRLERGDLFVDNSLFRDSQQGILAGNDLTHAISITRSTFSRLGTCEGAGGCAHSVYIGDYGRVTVSRCRFDAGTGGHYLKSRARRVAILDNVFDDRQGRATNYMIDLPNGAVGQITGNDMVQGRDKDNYSAFIAVGAEGVRHSSAGLAISGNSAFFAKGVERRSVFVADWTGEQLALGANRLDVHITAYQRR